MEYFIIFDGINNSIKRTGIPGETGRIENDNMVKGL